MTDIATFLLQRLDYLNGDINYLLNVGLRGAQYGTVNEALNNITTGALRDIAAKRKIVALHAPPDMGPYHDPKPWCPTCASRQDNWDDRAALAWPCPTLRLLAEPYADHDDYDPAWRI